MNPVSASPGAGLRRAWLAGGAGFVGLVIYLSLTPDPLAVPSVENVKTGHVLAYFWLMLWFSQLWHRSLPRLVLALALLALGVGLEYAQRQTGYRTFAYADMRDDLIGIAAGWAAATTVLGRVLAAGEALYARSVKFRKR
jgi:hypothetical protein